MRIHRLCYQISTKLTLLKASQFSIVVKNQPANAGDIRDTGSIPESGRASGGGHSNPLEYSCLENLMDREAWQAIVQGSQRVRHD